MRASRLFFVICMVSLLFRRKVPSRSPAEECPFPSFFARTSQLHGGHLPPLSIFFLVEKVVLFPTLFQKAFPTIPFFLRKEKLAGAHFSLFITLALVLSSLPRADMRGFLPLFFYSHSEKCILPFSYAFLNFPLLQRPPLPFHLDGEFGSTLCFLGN